MGYFDPLPIFRNFVEVELKEAVSSTDTRIYVTDIDKFPAVILRKDFLPCVIRDVARTVREVVYVTAIDPDNDELTVERAREGSEARNWPVGTTYVYHTFTADTVQRLRAGGFAPVLDSNGVRPAIKRLSNSSVQLTGEFTEIETGIAVRLMRRGGGYVVPNSGEIGIFASERTIANGKTTLEIINGVVPSDIVGIDIGIYQQAMPGTLGDNIYVTAAGGTRARTLNDHFGDFLNVKDYGARGDGSTNDTAAFEAAAAAAQQKNAVVYVPYGNYRVTSDVPGEFATLGHVTISGGGNVPITDLFDDFVRLDGDQTIKGNKTYASGYTTTFKGPVVMSGGLTVSGGESVTGGLSADSATIPVFKGAETHSGAATFLKGITVSSGATISGGMTVNGAETHNGDVVFSGGVTFSGSSATEGIVSSIIASEANGFYAPSSAGGKLRVDPSEFIVASGGLAYSASNNINKLYVDFDTMDKEMLRGVVRAMCLSGGGLNVVSSGNDKGKLYVDFSALPEDVVFAMLNGLKLPVHLDTYTSANSYNFYVNGDSSGSDVDDGEQGHSAAKPWKTIKFACQTIAKDYNIGSKTVYVNIAGGTYSETETGEVFVDMGTLNRSTGKVVLQPYNNGTVIVSLAANGAATGFWCREGGEYTLKGLDIRYAQGGGSGFYSYVFRINGNLTIDNCIIKYTDDSAGGTTRIIAAGGGNVSLTNGGSFNVTPGDTSVDVLYATNGGIIMANRESTESAATYTVKGTWNNFMHGRIRGGFRIEGSKTYRPRFNPVSSGATTSGTRYALETGAYAVVYAVNVGGVTRPIEEYFPGNTASGTVQSSTYCWYATD